MLNLLLEIKQLQKIIFTLIDGKAELDKHALQNFSHEVASRVAIIEKTINELYDVMRIFKKLLPAVSNPPSDLARSAVAYSAHTLKRLYSK